MSLHSLMAARLISIMAPKVIRATRVTLVHRVRKATRVIQEQQAQLVQPALQVHRVLKASRVHRVRQVQLAQQVLRDLRASRGQPVHRALRAKLEMLSLRA